VGAEEASRSTVLTEYCSASSRGFSISFDKARGR
jgi:hypothetical protein